MPLLTLLSLIYICCKSGKKEEQVAAVEKEGEEKGEEEEEDDPIQAIMEAVMMEAKPDKIKKRWITV